MEADMIPQLAFYEQARELGEVIWRGLRYRLFYEPERHWTISVLVPGQDQTVVR